MKKSSVIFVMALIILGACGPKSYHQTREGKKKTKYYNAIQFGADPHPKKTF